MVAQEQAQKEQRRLRQQQSREDARKTKQNSYESYANDEDGGAFSSITKTFENLEESTNEYLNSLNGVVSDGKSSLLKSAFKAKFF